MTTEEIQAIRNKYNYDPSSLNTGVNNPSLNTISLNDFQEQQPEQKKPTDVLGTAKATIGGIAQGASGSNLALSAIDYVGRKAVEALPENTNIAGVSKQQMIQNLQNAPSLNQQYQTMMGADQHQTAFNRGQIAGTVAAIAPTAIEQGGKLLATPTGQNVVNAVKEGVGAVKTTIADKALAKNVSKVENLINPSADLLTPLQKKEAITQGRQLIKNTKLGGTEVTYAPTEETKRASELLSGIIKPKDKPNIVFDKIKSTIATKGAQAEKYLADNPIKITNAEDANVFSAVKTQAEKNLTESELKAYDEQIKLFQKQLLGRKGGYTTENYYKALKDWEANIAEHLPKGKEALLDPTGVASAKIHAASDIRKAVRDLIASKHPEFKDKMYDIASLYEAKNNALQIASKVKSKSLLEKYPKTTSVIKNSAVYGGGALGINELLK